MKRRVAVITKDKYLFQKIYLILCDRFDIVTESDITTDAVLLDRDTSDIDADGAILMSRNEGAHLSVPFTREALLSAINEVDTAPQIRLGERCVYLRGEKIALTEMEFSLLSELVLANGEYKSRDALLRSVWNGEADGGILNVYIHYLREKLEADGEKIINSSRGKGYKIDEKYLKGGNL